jgi:hypothetical protein
VNRNLGRHRARELCAYALLLFIVVA